MKENSRYLAVILAILLGFPSASIAAGCYGPDQFQIYYDGYVGLVNTFYERGDNGKFLDDPDVSHGTVTVTFEPDDYGEFRGFMKINSSQDWRSSGVHLSIYRDERDCSLHISDGGGSILHSTMHTGRSVCVSQRGDTVRLTRCSP